MKSSVSISFLCLCLSVFCVVQNAAPFSLHERGHATTGSTGTSRTMIIMQDLPINNNDDHQGLQMVSSPEKMDIENPSSTQITQQDSTVNTHHDRNDNTDDSTVNIVLLAGFESFNKELYQNAVSSLPPTLRKNVNLQVFSDSEIRTGASVGVGGMTEEDVTNPKFVHAMKNADVFIGSLVFDYEDVVALEALMEYVSGPRLLFECATELMTYNRVGSFSMEVKEGEEGKMGPPPAVKAVLSKFSSGKEEDKLSGYLKLLKM